MPPKKRFLILTSDTGFGHRNAAESIAKALALRRPDGAEAVVVNPIREQAGPFLLKETQSNYDRTVTASPKWYRFTYSFFDSRPAGALVESAMIFALRRKLEQLIAAVRPEAILNMDLLFNAPAGAARNHLKEKPPLYTVVTDLADVHTLWFHPSPDGYFVASERVKDQAAGCGIPSGKIFVTGIPVDPDFASAPDSPARLRRRLGLDPSLPTLLFVGSRRVSGILPHLESLEEYPGPIQAAVVTGGDDALLEEIRSRRWRYPLLAQPFVTNMPEWMACADILVTKAGGLILSEALAAGLPIILIGFLPGQEEGNVRFLLGQNAGARAETPQHFPVLVDSWLRDGRALRNSIAANARQVGRPGAAFEIADALWQAADRKAVLPESAVTSPERT
jgi:1,2-diacylglycerol 3-beta-galactosyltransferase